MSVYYDYNNCWFIIVKSKEYEPSTDSYRYKFFGRTPDGEYFETGAAIAAEAEAHYAGHTVDLLFNVVKKAVLSDMVRRGEE